MYSDTYKVQNQFSLLPKTFHVNPPVHVTAVGWLPVWVILATTTGMKYHHIKFEMFNLWDTMFHINYKIL
jgi:hypothetical protein